MNTPFGMPPDTPDPSTLAPTANTGGYAPPPAPTGLHGVIAKLPRAFATIAAYRGNPAPLREIDEQEQRQDQLRQQAFSNTITGQRENRAQQMYDTQLQNFKAELQKRQFDQQEAQRKFDEHQHLQAATAIAAQIPQELIDPKSGMPDMTKLGARPDGSQMAQRYLEQSRGLPKGDTRKLAFDASGKGYWADSESESITPAMIGPGGGGAQPAASSPSMSWPGMTMSPPPAPTAPQPNNPMLVSSQPTATPQPQPQQFTSPSLKMPFPFGTPDAGIEAAVGPVPNPRSYSLGTADPKFREDFAAWGTQYNAMKLARDKELAAARGAAFSNARPIPGGVFDPESQQTIVSTPQGPVLDPRTHQPMLSGNQAGALGITKPRVTFAEVDQNLANVKKFIPTLDSASTGERVSMVGALTPGKGDTLMGKAGQLVEGVAMKKLSQNQRDLINTIRNLRQGVTSLRTVIAGAGGGSDYRLQILESEMPNEQDFMGTSEAMGAKLAHFESVYNAILDDYPQIFRPQSRTNAPANITAPTKPGKRKPLSAFEGKQ